MVCQLLDQALPHGAGAGQDPRRGVLLRRLQVGFRAIQGGFRGFQLGLGRAGEDTLANRPHDVVALGAGLGQRPLHGVEVGELALHGRHCFLLEQLEGLVGQQLGADARQERVLGVADLDAQAVAAGATLLRVVAAVAVGVHHHERAAAFAAADQAGQQVPWRPSADRAGERRGLAGDAALRGVPGFAIDDGQVGQLAHDPLALGAFPAHAATGFRILHPVRSIPDLLADVERVGEDADRALAIGAYRGRGPCAAVRRGNTVPVEAFDDLSRRPACNVFVEDPAHDGCLVLVDGALPGACDAVAVGDAAGARAFKRAAGEAAVGLLGEVVEVELAHEAAQPGVELGVVAGGVEAVGDRDHAHAGELQAAQGALHLDAVAREPGEIVDQDDAELVRTRQQGAVAGAILPGAADRGVGEGFWRWPAVPRGEFPAVAQLVLERRVALLVGGIAGVGGDAHGAGAYAAWSWAGNAARSVRFSLEPAPLTGSGDR